MINLYADHQVIHPEIVLTGEEGGDAPAHPSIGANPD